MSPCEREKGVDGVAEKVNDGHVLWQHDRKGVPVRMASGALVVLCTRVNTRHVFGHLAPCPEICGVLTGCCLVSMWKQMLVECSRAAASERDDAQFTTSFHFRIIIRRGSLDQSANVQAAPALSLASASRRKDNDSKKKHKLMPCPNADTKGTWIPKMRSPRVCVPP